MRLVKVILNSNISGNEKWDKTWRSLKTRLFLRKHVKRYYSPIYRQLKSVSYKSVFVIVNLLHQEQVIFEKMFFKKIVDPKSVIFQYLFNFSNFFLSYSYSFLFFFFHLEWIGWQGIRTAGIIMHYITDSVFPVRSIKYVINMSKSELY